MGRFALKSYRISVTTDNFSDDVSHLAQNLLTSRAPCTFTVKSGGEWEGSVHYALNLECRGPKLDRYQHLVAPLYSLQTAGTYL